MSLVDSLEREKALSLDNSFIIRAPAGSGKTELLVQRLLCALAKQESPHQCLILTFTQKAVRELQERLVKIFCSPKNELLEKTAYLREKVLEHAKELSWSMTTFWHQVKIKTIDAFFKELVEKYYTRSSLPGSMRQISPEIQSELIVKEFFYEYLIKDPDPDFVELCALYENSFTQIQSLLEKLYLTRETWIIPLFSQQDKLPCAQSLLKEQLGRYETLILKNKDDLERLFLWKSSYDKAESIDFSESNWVYSLSFWKSYAQMMVTDSGTWRKKLTKHQGFVADKDLHPWHDKKEKKELIEIFFEIQSEYYDDPHMLKFLTLLTLWPDSFIQTDYQQRWLTLLKKLLAFSMIYKEKKGYIDYSDITLNLWTLFDDQEQWALISSDLDKNVQHLFLDECQDLSLIQFSLIKKILSVGAYEQEKTFFVVGDPQQAIYHFRGSQVGVFQAFENLNFDGVTFETLHLKTNFRSQRHLVSFYNRWSAHVFSSVSSPFLGIDKSLEASSIKPEDTGDILAYCYPSQQTEARSIALRLKKYLQSHKNQSIAILARDRQTLKPIIKQFLLLDIPFKTTGIYHLLDIEKYFDTYMLARLLINPCHKPFWVPAMRSLFLGASAQDLLIFFSEDRENFFELTTHPDLSPTFQTLYQKLKKHYEQFNSYIGRMRLDKWLRNFFVSYGFEQYLSKVEKTLWLKIFSCFQSYTFDSVEWKIIEKQLGSLVVESPTEASVEIMTIHQSKGLEFDSIYLPNLAAALPHSKSQLLYSIQTELHHLWAMLPPPSQECQTVQFCQFLTKLHREHEFVRLLYVALTRAKSSLYLSCNQEKNFGKNFKTFLEPFIFFEEQKVTFQKRVEYPDRQSIFLIPKDHVISELDWRYVSFNSEPLSIPVVSRAQERNRILGLVWHKILQYNKTWPLDTRFLVKDSLEGLFYSFGAMREDISYLMSDFSKIYQSIKDSSHGKSFYSGQYIQDEREYAFTYEKGGKLIKKIIDKFIEHTNGELRVIEVKTASLSKVSTELLLTYEKQTLFYQKYLSLLFEKPCHGSVWFLGDDSVYETQVML